MSGLLRLCAMLALLLPALAARADGFAYGKGFSAQLRETDQLAVIDLTRDSADVSMYIAIQGIPPGEELTYVLPFWHEPLDFTMREEPLAQFRAARVAPMHEKVKHLERISQAADNIVPVSAPMLFGLAGTVVSFSTGTVTRMKAHQGSSLSLTPYATHTTPHARAELYKIGGDDLQQLVAQAGLPEQYAEPLRKYTTPYFAVMTLTGLPVKEKAPYQSGDGVHYRFRHTLTDGTYTYPLGTGAAWPTPIPVTQVYIACPDAYALDITAPVEGELEEWKYFQLYTSLYPVYSSMTPERQREWEAERSLRDGESVFPTITASFISRQSARPLIWHRAYFLSNPSEDIRVTVNTRPQAWRIRVAGFFAHPKGPFAASLAVYLLAWLLTAGLLIRPNWRRAEHPLPFWWYVLRVFGFSQLAGALIVAGLLVLLGLSATDNFAYTIGLIVILFVLVGVAYKPAIISWRQRRDRDKWLNLTAWFASSGIYCVLVGGLYFLLRWCAEAV